MAFNVLGIAYITVTSSTCNTCSSMADVLPKSSLLNEIRQSLSDFWLFHVERFIDVTIKNRIALSMVFQIGPHT